MIPRDFITEWRDHAPWTNDAHVEQDLLLSRAIVELFSRSDLAAELAFRGGTALYKLHVPTPVRYSEDIDLVQVTPGPIGAILGGVRAALDPWLGGPHRTTKEQGTTLAYRVASEGQPSVPLRLKIEINSREHFSVFGLAAQRFEVRSRWFAGAADVTTYHLDELLGTKLRALYQRKKGRDLFDLWYALRTPSTSPQRIVEAFTRYIDHGGQSISRAELEANLAAKADDPRFLGDIAPLLAAEVPWDPAEAFRVVRDRLVAALPGDPWRGATPSAPTPPR